MDYDFEVPIVWIISMHLNVTAYKINENAHETVVNYATLPIGMFSIRESPHDPNK